MKQKPNYIHLPELSLDYDTLKNHLKNLYKIDITMGKIDYEKLADSNVWGLNADEIRKIEKEGSYDTGNHWVFSKINNKDYEALYDGLYMHVFGSLEDLMVRENEINSYEYDSDKSEENGEETFVDSEGNERSYEEKAEKGKKVELSPKGYKYLFGALKGSMLERRLESNGVDIVANPDPSIKGYVIVYIKNNKKNIEKAKDVISGRMVAAKGKKVASVPEKIKVAYYNWGEYSGDEEIDLVDLPGTRLDKNQLAGFLMREEDKDKFFYASDHDIDSDSSGTAVKHAYATVENHDIAAKGKMISIDDNLESIRGYDFRKNQYYVFSIGMHVEWFQAGRWLKGNIIAIRRPKYHEYDNNQWSVHVKSDSTGVTLYTKVYFLISDKNEEAKSKKLPYDLKNKERLALIYEMVAEADKINDADDVNEMRADIADVNESTSEYKQYWVMNSLIDFIKYSPRIDYFVNKAKELGWANQYAEHGKKISDKSWIKFGSYDHEKAKNGMWFKEAIEENEPFTLGGWRKSLPAGQRRSLALHSREKGTKHEKYVSAGRALQALANVTKDADTKEIAGQDADYFFLESKKFENGGGVGSGKNGKEIAHAILEQLGGMNRLNAMTGAYNFIGLNDGLSFRIKNPTANYIKIILNGKDLYDLEVGRIRGEKYTIVSSQKDLYNDMLKSAIEKATGMYLTLANGGKISKERKYRLGDKWTHSFDYTGMFDKVLKLSSSENPKLEHLKKLKASLVDVNYHTQARILGEAIEKIELGDEVGGKKELEKLHESMLNEMADIYVSHYLDGFGTDRSIVLNQIGMEISTDVDEHEQEKQLSEARQKALDYFHNNPDKMLSEAGTPFVFANGGMLNSEITEEDIDNLAFIYDRMHDVHGEKESHDYMIKFKEIIENLKK